MPSPVAETDAFGTLVRRARQRARRSPAELAARPGCGQTRISDLEVGRAVVLTPLLLERISDVLGIPMGALLPAATSRERAHAPPPVRPQRARRTGPGGISGTGTIPAESDDAAQPDTDAG